jgi:predicted dehydrogenase
MSMRAGKPCYIEKPLAASYEDCLRINRISEETGVPCFVAYYRRYLPYFQKVKEIINDGTLGKILNVQIQFSVPPRDLDYQSTTNRPWRLQPDISGGGYFYDLAPHQLDLLQDLFGIIIRHTVTPQTGRISIRPKTPSAHHTSLHAAYRAVPRGASWATTAPRKTASSWWATRVR